MIVAIIQARMTSSRLPGKVLKPILGRPMLEFQIERLRRAHRIDRIVVATSTDSSDGPIAKLCDRLGVDCFRGSLNDVLDRFYRTALAFHATEIVRLTGDCPLIDPGLIDHLIACHLDGGYDYSTLSLEPTYPHGLDAEIVTFAALERAWAEAELTSDREHVTLYLYKRAKGIRLGSVKQDKDQSSIRLTVDHPEDFAVVSRIFEALYPADQAFNTADVIAFLEAYPEVARLNAHYRRSEGIENTSTAHRQYCGSREAAS
jgi:spore coat polysaccharide biosynthesis protein SpsF